MLNDLELRSYWFYKLQSYWLLQASTLFSYYYNRYNVCIMDMHAYIYTQTMDILKPLLPFTLLRALTVPYCFYSTSKFCLFFLFFIFIFIFIFFMLVSCHYPYNILWEHINLLTTSVESHLHFVYRCIIDCLKRLELS